MILKPQDVLVLLKLAGSDEAQQATYAELGASLGMSASEVLAGVRRAKAAGFIRDVKEARRPRREPLLEFLIHGLRYVFVPDRGRMTRGVATAHAAPVLADLIEPGDEPPPVWPHPEGTTRGISFEPLYRSAPFAALQDSSLYDRLALVDAIRGGTARERAAAVDRLKARL